MSRPWRSSPRLGYSPKFRPKTRTSKAKLSAEPCFKSLPYLIAPVNVYRSLIRSLFMDGLVIRE